MISRVSKAGEAGSFRFSPDVVCLALSWDERRDARMIGFSCRHGGD
jgi:hypothetical protein